VPTWPRCCSVPYADPLPGATARALTAAAYAYTLAGMAPASSVACLFRVRVRRCLIPLAWRENRRLRRLRPGSNARIARTARYSLGQAFTAIGRHLKSLAVRSVDLLPPMRELRSLSRTILLGHARAFWSAPGLSYEDKLAMSSAFGVHFRVFNKWLRTDLIVSLLLSVPGLMAPIFIFPLMRPYVFHARRQDGDVLAWCIAYAGAILIGFALGIAIPTLTANGASGFFSLSLLVVGALGLSGDELARIAAAGHSLILLTCSAVAFGAIALYSTAILIVIVLLSLLALRRRTAPATVVLERTLRLTRRLKDAHGKWNEFATKREIVILVEDLASSLEGSIRRTFRSGRAQDDAWFNSLAQQLAASIRARKRLLLQPADEGWVQLCELTNCVLRANLGGNWQLMERQDLDTELVARAGWSLYIEMARTIVIGIFPLLMVIVVQRSPWAFHGSYVDFALPITLLWALLSLASLDPHYTAKITTFTRLWLGK
jgi:hypothetical protein